MATLMAHLSSPKLADQLFDELAHLPPMWRFDRVERNHTHGAWYVSASTPTSPSTGSGVSGTGPTITTAVRSLYERIEKYDREHGR